MCGPGLRFSLNAGFDFGSCPSAENTCTSHGLCETKAVASDAQSEDYFGRSVSISTDMAIVGAAYEDEGGTDTGAAYFFKLENGQWQDRKKLSASDVQAGDAFGSCVSVSGEMAIVGSPGDAEGARAVYIYKHQ